MESPPQVRSEEHRRRFKGFTLNTFQQEAWEAIRAGENVLVAAPTGAGKTLVAELAIDEALRRGRRAIYTSPIKALSNQKYRDFRADGLEVGLMTGDLSLNADAPVLIMTTEIFRNAVFEDPDRYRDVEFLIFDEIHFLDDISRGTVWEECLIFAPHFMRFIGLSATIENLAQFGNWLEEVRGRDLSVIQEKRRPVPLTHQLYHPEVGLFDLAQRKRARQTIARNTERERGAGGRRRHMHRRDREHGRHGRPRGRMGRPGPRPYQQLLNLLIREHKLPILYFCFSRKECAIKAERNTRRRLLNHKEQRRMHELFLDICERFELEPERDPELGNILHRALRGVGFHHAGMLPIHKEVVERLFTSGLLRLLFTTETFALGINMPARTVVFDSLKKYDGVSMDYMRARDYLQMAGRAGRQGIDKEGLVVSILEEEDVDEAPLPAFVGGKVEPVMSRFNLSYSTILNLYDRMGMGLLDAYDRSFAAFQAATGSRKSRDKKRAAAREALRERIAILEDAGYLGDEGVLPRGQIARQINGYEIQVTELLFGGVLEDLGLHELAVLFCSLVYEDRRPPDRRGHGEPSPFDGLRKDVDRAIRRFAAIELLHDQKDTIKMADFGAARAIDAWSHGCDIARLERVGGMAAGDLVRCMRMAVQMMRQMHKAVGRGIGLRDRLEEAIVAINRDEVDAKRQFELG